MADYIKATFKLLLIGDSGVGKSCLLVRFADDAYTDAETHTIGVDFRVVILDVGSEKYRLTIWDTAGQERFRTLTSSYYRGAQGVILVYDVTNRPSFEHLQTWLGEVDAHNATPDVVKMVVGNKIDKDAGGPDGAGGRAVSRAEGEAFARQLGTLYVEVSAKTKTGVMTAFQELVRKIVETPSLWQKGAAAGSGDRPAGAGAGGGVRLMSDQEAAADGGYCAC